MQAAPIPERTPLLLDRFLQERPPFDWHDEVSAFQLSQILFPLLDALQMRHLQNDAVELEQLGGCPERVLLLLGPLL